VLRRLGSSPSGRERLALARALNALAGSPAATVLPFARPAVALSRSTFRWAAALAAGLLVAAGLSWVALESHHGGESVAWVPRERPAPAHPVAPRPPEVQAQAKAPAPAPPPEPVKSVFQLALTSLRGSEAAETLRVRPGSDVELRISVEGMEDLKSFRLAVQNRRRETVWEGTLEPTTLQGVRVLVIDLSAGRLPTGHYEIAARGLAPDREAEELSPLEFEVVAAGTK
jgi:hypothetical protein